jgi:hypothetical protein
MAYFVNVVVGKPVSTKNIIVILFKQLFALNFTGRAIIGRFFIPQIFPRGFCWIVS